MPDDLMQIARGFMESRVLLTAVELDLFTAVGAGATADEVARACGAHPRGATVLLDALAAMGLVTKQGGRYANTPTGARFLGAASPDSGRAALLHSAHLWRRWGDEDWTTAFIAAMHKYAAGRAPHVVAAVGTAGVSRMLDVGGGSGAYSIAFARAAPGLRAEIFDLASVVPIARGHIAQAGLADRVTTRVGDLTCDDLGSGHDLVLLSAICHMLGPDGNRDLLRRAARALAPGGRLVIQDHILRADRTAPRAGALFAINMLVGTEQGSTYTEEEYSAWMIEAGLGDVQHVTLVGPNGLMIGRRSG